MTDRQRKFLQIVLGGLALMCFITALVVADSNCEDPIYDRGDTVTHRLTGERAIVASSFCNGSADGRHRAYRVSTGKETGDQMTYWGQFEITR